ncbi:MAG: glycosyltransferase family 4 protein [Planctomycetes bacterium]|jgi:glycosyltransferase involved in cell wall biosynthesis|nr:glycosyltransferase family 4 protein [Planctomycetota bacterium]
MKIAQVVCVFPPYHGGIGNSAKNIAEILSSEHEVTTFTIDYRDDSQTKKIKNQKSTESTENINYQTVKLKAWPGLGKAGFLWSLFFHLNQFDVVYFHYPFFGSDIVIWLWKLFSPQKRLYIHYHMQVQFSFFWQKIFALPSYLIRYSLFKKADKIIVASLDYITNSELKKFFNKQATKFIEIPFSVNLKKFFPQTNDNEPAQILFVGGLDKAHYFKGVNVLLSALSQITLNFKATIIGQGELKNEYQIQAQKLGLNEKILFLDSVDDLSLPQYYRRSDIFVFPSLNQNEAFGLVLLEALASGVPVIASNLPGVRTVFQEGKQGLLIKPGSISDLKDKLNYLLTNQEKRKNMAKAARLLIEERYDSQKIKEKYLNLFKTIKL